MWRLRVLKILWTRIQETLVPFSVIARELTTLRELYELELSSRKPPIIRVTESPGDDTEVMYGVEPKRRKDELEELWENSESSD
jgi:hypothetical protein